MIEQHLCQNVRTGQHEKIIVTYYINVIKRKTTWQSQSRDTEKAFVNSQNLFMIGGGGGELCMNRNKNFLA